MKLGAAVAGDLRRAVTILAAALIILWAVLAANYLFFGGHLLRFGILPRSVSGLRGIAFAPFLHAGVAHLAGNSVGIVLLGGLILLRDEADFWIVTIAGGLIGGFATWLLARPLIHVGASGVIFAYFGYLLCTGLFERRLGAIALSLFALVAWGGLAFGVLPGQPGVSWESHLFGLIGGAAAAWLIARYRRRLAAAR